MRNVEHLVKFYFSLGFTNNQILHLLAHQQHIIMCISSTNVILNHSISSFTTSLTKRQEKGIQYRTKQETAFISKKEPHGPGGN